LDGESGTLVDSSVYAVEGSRPANAPKKMIFCRMILPVCAVFIPNLIAALIIFWLYDSQMLLHPFLT
jgi:hypothetical protein